MRCAIKLLILLTVDVLLRASPSGGWWQKFNNIFPPLDCKTYNIPGKRLLDTPLLLMLRHVFGGKLLLELHWVNTHNSKYFSLWPQNINTEIEHDACFAACCLLPATACRALISFGIFLCYTLTVARIFPGTLI